MLKFKRQFIAAKFIGPSGRMVEKPIEIRTHPITGRTCRIAFSRIHIQRFYRSICRNGYNLGLLAVETPAGSLELRVAVVVRSNYARWVRSDFTGYEVMLGDMATFVAPEQTAAWSRPFFAT